MTLETALTAAVVAEAGAIAVLWRAHLRSESARAKERTAEAERYERLALESRGGGKDDNP